MSLSQVRSQIRTRSDHTPHMHYELDLSLPHRTSTSTEMGKQFASKAKSPALRGCKPPAQREGGVWGGGGGLGCRGCCLGDPSIQIIPIMKKQMEKKTENYMEHVAIKGSEYETKPRWGSNECKDYPHWAV